MVYALCEIINVNDEEKRSQYGPLGHPTRYVTLLGGDPRDGHTLSSLNKVTVKPYLFSVINTETL